MPRPISRREVLKQMGTATASLVATGGLIHGQGANIVVAGRPVEIAVTSVSPATVRILVVPIPIEEGRAAPAPATGTLVGEDRWRPAGRGRTAAIFRSVKAGNLVGRFSADPPTF